MNALEAIRKRRSVRKFTGQPVPKSDLETIVDAGRLAATGHNEQPWDFIVITQKETIMQFLPAAPWIIQAGAVIAVVLDEKSRWWLEDGAAAIQNMLIACTALGYGACWVQGDVIPREEHFKDLLDIPDHKRLMALVPVGIPAEAPEREKKPLQQVLHWEKF
ncbi:MAG: nitroreductase family protein [Anaerolineales bacterium]|nr:nitroreductase family protein [Anaerolineales bacterium]MDW8278374.1 nitroreductase family protein [Anaerolineales bacterium]